MKQIDVSVWVFFFCLARSHVGRTFLLGKKVVPRSFHKFVSVPKMTGSVFQAI